MPHKHSVRPTHISPISPTIHTIPMQCPGPVSASSPAGAQRRERVRMLMLQGPRGPRRGRMPLRSAVGADLKPGLPDRGIADFRNVCGLLGVLGITSFLSTRGALSTRCIR